ncbi:lipoprotein-releasing ABC transporter permease subunit [Catenovulum sp. 2E275]|uniref:lipoprotein-releasing ABC transporter permease subunit n=1 Tax=Catenovulum sp. 2E275 TaxID=2980497 RepID=UPI0021D3018C|nr:lipoprotein-releasing ABC transporter permease subunit [Catenovulum sp. 2E275]MCU4675344.1 lipoprotein-releasing ABC transporter permease subunit [Catenovulum sp. 2E275]
MFYPTSLFIAQRYSRGHQSNKFVSFITFFSVAGISLGVIALISVISVMNGFESELKKRILGVIPHMVVQQSQAETPNFISDLQNTPNVIGVTPFEQQAGLVQSAQDMRAIYVQGIEPSESAKYSIIAHNIVYGDFYQLKPRQYQVVIAQQLANQLDVRVGDKIRVMLAKGSTYTPMGRVPVQRNFTVAAIFNAGSDADANVVLIHIQDLNRLLRQPVEQVSSVRLYLDDAFNLNFAKQSILAKHPDWQITDWRQTQGELFEAVKMEKNMMWLMLALIIAVATFNIVSALVMVVNDKRVEIASLKTIGMTNRQLVMIFILQGMYKGCVGAVIGTVAGVLLSFNLNNILAVLGVGIFANPAYAMQGLPIDLHWHQVILIALSAIFMSFLATIYPAYRAASTKPAEILRYE